MDLAATSPLVLVTGGSGYLAGWTIAHLLEQGFRVRTTVRSPAREGRVRADLATLVAPGVLDAPDRLVFSPADLLQDAGWDRAMAGVDYVIHTASPTSASGPAGQDCVTPAREGTLRVLRSARTAGVQRVVMTSSLAAALPAPSHGTRPTDEGTWTDLSMKGTSEYVRSKTLAELAAWDYLRGKPKGTSLTTILPGVIQGPLMGGYRSPSLEIVARMLRGESPRLPRIGFGIVDVRDLVQLHLLAMVHPDAVGQRFIGTAEFMWRSDIAQLLRTELGVRAAKVSTDVAPDWQVKLAAPFNPEAAFALPHLGQHREFSSERAARLLGWRPRPAREAVLATANGLLEAGLA